MQYSSRRRITHLPVIRLKTLSEVEYDHDEWVVWRTSGQQGACHTLECVDSDNMTVKDEKGASQNSTYFQVSIELRAKGSHRGKGTMP